ncbi:phosphotransferase system mannose-type iia component [Lucifera butyrica]|uniref:Phosphotransferase system mannose-type iia component n=1 Tax=Lucifera butyrica TaxID=1351585 RepID=A0A498RC29_9FIRM|nr:sigma 54-interacting transcriptional regulator [Lucifera butyrica]VBB08941.1 phosphotransferase system mannose-type iia component [Lucifera butyrica]
MKNKLQDIISLESRKEPYTDMELSERMSVSREYVTLLRKELNIADSRERKKLYICTEIQEILNSQPTISYRKLSQIMKEKGYGLSRYLLDKYLDEVRSSRGEDSRAEGREIMPEGQPERESETYQAFANLVGSTGSLEVPIQQAKAAMIYPPNGLHCLILGETGVGKSELAEAMYKFAVETGRLKSDSPFIVFNCADYAENAQLLMSHLFGHVKGAYTGAVGERKGLIEQAHGGVLFLDEVHRLTSEGQEMLFQLIDKGQFRRLGESEFVRMAKVQLIAATTENTETTLLATFKRRIPMIIELPSLNKRPLRERLNLITRFFGYESTRMNAPIQVRLDVLKALLLYDCLGNIGQLKSDIQVVCAKSFLTYVMDKDEYVKVEVADLSIHVKKGLMKITHKRQEMEALIWQDFIFRPDRYLDANEIDNDIYSFPKEFYSYIEKSYVTYKKQGLNTKEINRILGSEIERKLQSVIKHVKDNGAPISREEIAKVVGAEITAIVEEILKIAEKRLGELDTSIFYCLAIHLHATFNRLDQGREIVNPNLDEIKEKFRNEYVVAVEMVEYLKNQWSIDLPDDEVGYITLYLQGNKKENEGKVGVLVVTHGNAGAAMLEISNKLLNVNHGQALAMALEESPTDVLEQLITLAEAAEEGKGVLLLVDMGSLLTFGEIIGERTGITIETIERVDTVMVIEGIRRSILPGSKLSDVVSAIENLNYISKKGRVNRRILKRPQAIITICLTGEGIALHCSRYLKKIFGNQLIGIKLINMGVIGKLDMYKQIQSLGNQYDIVAIIGSIDPQYPGIPYISLDDLYHDNSKERILRLLEYSGDSRSSAVNSSLVPAVVREAQITLNLQSKNKQDVIKNICDRLLKEGYVKKGYYEAVLKRERMGSFIINQEVVLPHADSSYVNRPTVVIAKMAEPVLWDRNNKVSIVCLLALDIHGKDGVRYLYNKFKDQNILLKLKQSQSEQEFKGVLLNE